MNAGFDVPAAGEVPSTHVLVSVEDLTHALRELQALRAMVEVTGLAFLGDLQVELPSASLCYVLGDVGRRLGALEDLLGYDDDPAACTPCDHARGLP